MVEIKSIDQLLHFMKGNLHLSRYDEKFIDNLSTLKQVTTNQVVLLHTLVFKYKRQFTKHELFVEKLVDLPWNVTVVESSPQYTDGHLTIENDTIEFKCPFNRNFIDAFRKVSHNNFIWSKEKRHYEAPYNQHSLKILLATAQKFFNTIHLCSESQRMIEEVKEYDDVKYWNPTLVRLNGNLFIVAMNESLNEALGNIELNTDVETLAKLSGYGITVDPSIHNYSRKNVFAASSVVQIEHSDIKEVITWLKELKCDMVYLSGAGLLNLLKKKIIEELKEEGIPFSDTSTIKSISDAYKFPVMFRLKKNIGSNYDPCKVAKIIHVVNSIPINIK